MDDKSLRRNKIKQRSEQKNLEENDISNKLIEMRQNKNFLNDEIILKETHLSEITQKIILEKETLEALKSEKETYDKNSLELESLKKEITELKISRDKINQDIKDFHFSTIEEVKVLQDKIYEEEKEKYNTRILDLNKKFEDEKIKKELELLSIDNLISDKKNKLDLEYDNKKYIYDTRVKQLDDLYEEELQKVLKSVEEEGLRIKKEEEKRNKMKNKKVFKGIQTDSINFKETHTLEISEYSNTFIYEKKEKKNISVQTENTQTKSLLMESTGDQELTLLNFKTINLSDLDLTKRNIFKKNHKLKLDKKIDFMLNCKLNKNFILYFYDKNGIKIYELYYLIKKNQGKHLYNILNIKDLKLSKDKIIFSTQDHLNIGDNFNIAYTTTKIIFNSKINLNIDVKKIKYILSESNDLFIT